MPLGREVELGPRDIVLDGDAAPPKGAQLPIFGPCLLWPDSWMDQDVTSYEGIGLSLSHIVLDRDPAP